MTKIILTLEQSKMLYERTINEIVHDINLLNEGAWENIKYALSKLGRYKANGKIFGKSRIDKEVIEKIQGILDKKGNEIIKNLDTAIKQNNPEFPNNKNGKDFLLTILDISRVYDSIVGATRNGSLPPDAGNVIIDDLRKYVKKFLDVDLTAAYSVVDEIEGNRVEINSEELTEIDFIHEINEDEASDVRKHLQGKRDGGDDFKSYRMSTLKSDKLPLTLASIGASLGAFKWLVNTEWFKHLFEHVTPDTVTDTITQKTQIFNDVKNNEGVYKLLSKVTNHHLDGNSNPQQFIDALKQIGGGDANTGVDLLCQDHGVMMHPKEAAAGLHDLINNPDKYHKMGNFFIGGHGTSGTGKLTPRNTTLYGTISGARLASILIKIIPGIVIKGGVRVGAGYAAAKGLANILGPVGIGLLGAGALVKAMRMKGQRQSRAKTLNDLYQSIRNVEGGTGIISQTIGNHPNVSKNVISRGNDVNSSLSTNYIDELYNMLKRLFQFIVNNKKMLGNRGGENVGTGGAMANRKMRAGDKFTYNGKKVTILNSDLGNGKAQVQYPNGAKMALDIGKLERLYENILYEDNIITDKRLVQFLNKKLSFDKLKSFEEFMNRIEKIRDSIKKINNSDDHVLEEFLTRFKTNPIMATDFRKMFNVPVDNAQAVNSLKSFIDDLFVTVYSGKYKFTNLIDKMSGLGGGNINKLEEGDAYTYDNPNKNFIRDAQDRRVFKKNLLAFLETSISLFQYLYKIKTKESGEAKNAVKNDGVNEDIHRIKKIMFENI